MIDRDAIGPAKIRAAGDLTWRFANVHGEEQLI
jgi:hypothetical protein